MDRMSRIFGRNNTLASIRRDGVDKVGNVVVSCQETLEYLGTIQPLSLHIQLSTFSSIRFASVNLCTVWIIPIDRSHPRSSRTSLHTRDFWVALSPDAPRPRHGKFSCAVGLPHYVVFTAIIDESLPVDVDHVNRVTFVLWNKKNLWNNLAYIADIHTRIWNHIYDIPVRVLDHCPCPEKE